MSTNKNAKSATVTAKPVVLTIDPSWTIAEQLAYLKQQGEVLAKAAQTATEAKYATLSVELAKIPAQLGLKDMAELEACVRSFRKNNGVISAPNMINVNSDGRGRKGFDPALLKFEEEAKVPADMAKACKAALKEGESMDSVYARTGISGGILGKWRKEMGLGKGATAPAATGTKAA